MHEAEIHHIIIITVRAEGRQSTHTYACQSAALITALSDIVAFARH